MILGPNQGLTVAVSRGSYRIKTGTQIYEFQERGRKPTLAIKQKIDFRVERGHAYVKQPNGKEKRYEIVGQETVDSGGK